MFNILLVEDHIITSMGMQLIIKQVTEGSKLYTAESFQSALQIANENKIELVILDLSIPGSIGTGMVKEFRSQNADVKILIFSGRDELLNAPSYLNCGADGYLSKTSTSEETTDAIQTVINGKRYLSHALRATMNTKNGSAALGANTNPIETLSPREKQVYEMMMQGKITKSIAQQLNIKYSTVSTQKLRVYEKFSVNNLVDLIKKTESIIDELKPRSS